MRRNLRPARPAEMPAPRVLVSFGLIQNALALTLAVTPRWINEIDLGTCATTTATPHHRARYAGTLADSWMTLHAAISIEESKVVQGRRPIESMPLHVVRAGC